MEINDKVGTARQSFKLSPDDYAVIKTIEERWNRDELIARLCEDLLYR